MFNFEKRILKNILGDELYELIPEEMREAYLVRIKNASIKYFSKNLNHLKSANALRKLIAGKEIDERLIKKPGSKDHFDEISREIAVEFAGPYVDLIIRDQPKTVIVLDGGGIKGCFQLGALYYLSQFWDTMNIIGVAGTSTGAINALVLSESGKDAASKMVEQYLSAESWRDFFEEQPWYQLLRQLAKDAEIEIDFINENFSYEFLRTGEQVFGLISLVRVIRDYLANRKQLTSIFNLNPIMMKLSANIDFNQVGSKANLRMYMVNYEDGKLCYMDQDGIVYNRDGTFRENYEGGIKETLLKKGARASASIPFFLPAIGLQISEMDEEHGFPFTNQDFFIDGGVRENLPLLGGKEMGAERIISIVCSDTEPDLKTTLPTLIPEINQFVDNPPLLNEVLFRSLELFQRESLLNEKEPPYGFNDNIERIFINAHYKVIDRLNLDPGLVRINIDDGYMTAWEVINLPNICFDPIDSANYVIDDAARKVRIVWCKELITETRKQIWELENELIKYPANSMIGDVFIQHPIMNETILREIRPLKRSLLDLTLERFVCANNDPQFLPIEIIGNNGAKTSIHDWWEKWERHSTMMPICNDLQTSPWDDPWAGFAADPNYVEEIPIDQRPTTDKF